MYALATFGVGFFMRPLGAIVIGRYGDRRGRKPAMMWSFGLMGSEHAGHGVDPSYAYIGVAAPVLLLCFRLLQGFALAERSARSPLMPRKRRRGSPRALRVRCCGTGQGLAVLCSGLIGYSLSRLLSPGISILTAGASRSCWACWSCPIGLLIRSRLPETLERAVAQEAGEPAGQSPWRVFFVGLLVVGAGTIAGYALTYLATYAQDTLKLGASSPS